MFIKISLPIGLFFVFFTFAPLFAYSLPETQDRIRDAIQAELNQLGKDPETFYQKHRQKYGETSNRLVLDQRINPEQKIKLREKYLNNLYKNKQKSSVLGLGGLVPFSEIDLQNDDPNQLVEGLNFRTLEQMQGAQLMARRLSFAPWSGSYWPLYLGNTAYRYADPNFPSSSDWRENSDYLLDTVGSQDLGENLSPAEKYDSLVEDTDFTLAKYAINKGQSLYDSEGEVATWAGICHGWAPASFMVARPKKTINVRSPSGKQIVFYPSDIKALASMQWANGTPRLKMIGGRCNVKDMSSERPLYPDCLDTNPGTWHLSVVNQVGALGRGLVLDATVDYEVWNQPILGYRYSYFNPRTRLSTGANLEAAKAYRWGSQPFIDDRFAIYRSPQSTAIVGIVMDLTYMVETTPDHMIFDGPEYDKIQTVRYFYDLELDPSGNIVGGEWYIREHPDFLWTPPVGAQAFSTGDNLINQGVTAAAKVGSANGQPLSLILKNLIQWSQ